MKPIVIIPALNPDEKLITLVENLNKTNLKIVIVNDGSGPEYNNIFETLKSQLFCEVCVHPKNMGKGAALKTGMQYAALNYPEACGYVTADADGQHTAEDILKVANSLEKNPDKYVLGSRDFNEKSIPFKSRWGNRITSFVFLFSTGKRCDDTQTGLRGIPRKYTEICFAVPGNRYEYEMNLLLEMVRQGIPLVYEPIATIYLEGNQSSHFNPVKDSIIIYLNILKYSLSSLISALTDLSLFTVFANLIFGVGSAGILAATVLARLISGGVNYTCNKYWVFESKKHSVNEAFKYFCLFCCQMLASWFLVSSLSSLPLNLTFIKMLADGTLFFISYQIQKNYIFQTQKKGVQFANDEICRKAA
jgi:glycosyltransferase involved in cell wall biosynthesis